MIVKKKWTELLTANNLNSIIDSNLLTQAQWIDEDMYTKFGITTQLKTFLNYINTAFFTSSEGNNQWSGMNIFMSSFAVGDQRFRYLLYDKLQKYFAFYHKFITDDGLAHKIVTSKTYSDAGSKQYSDANSGQYSDTASGSSSDKDIHSELPQIQLNNFEQGINYASTMDKNEGTTSGTSSGSNSSTKSGSSSDTKEGTSGETKTSVTWDEAMANLRTTLFNDLVAYVTRLPNIIYNYYCTDTMPFTEAIKSAFKYFENLSELYML